MIKVTFNTKSHTMVMESKLRGKRQEYSNIMTIHTDVKFYEVRQRLESIDKNVPILRLPISKTIISYIHE